MKNFKKPSDYMYLSAGAFYFASLASFLFAKNNTMGFMWLCLGSCFLCLASVNSKKK